LAQSWRCLPPFVGCLLAQQRHGSPPLIGEPLIAASSTAKSLATMAALLEWREFLAAVLARSFERLKHLTIQDCRS
jgi:hypothetical protein